MGPISYVHPRFRTPTVAIVIHATVALALALAGSFRALALLSAVARLTTYLVTCLGVPILRKRTEGTFRPSTFIVPILGALVALLIVFTLDAKRLLAGAIAIAVGTVLYFVTTPRRGAAGS
jgi:amino acid transporter